MSISPRLKRCLIPAILLLVAILPVSAQEKPDIRKMMPADQQAASGIDQLTPDQITVLNAWLETLFKQTEAKAEVLVTQKVEERIAEEKRKLESSKQEEERSFFGLKVNKGDSVDEMKSHIVGDFFGWDGDTYFVLDNGQIWRQRMPASYYKKLKNPAVKIEKRALGYWLILIDTKASCPVKRVK